jgi:hypothetical protein
LEKPIPLAAVFLHGATLGDMNVFIGTPRLELRSSPPGPNNIPFEPQLKNVSHFYEIKRLNKLLYYH